VSRSRTRRELVASAGTIAIAGALGAEIAAARAAAPGDAVVLERTLKIEHLVVTAYRTALASRRLQAAVASRVEQMLRQELEHVALLEHALRRLGASAPPAPADLAASERALAAHHVGASLAGLDTQKQCLKLLIDIETLAEDAYFQAVGKLKDPALVRMSAQIMGCEAQHWTVLSAARHHGDVKLAVPYPFVGGTL